MSLRVAALLLTLLPAGAATSLPQPAQDGLEFGSGPLWVEVHETDEGQVCAIRAEKVPVHAVMERVADALGLELSGFDAVARAALVDVELRDRPLYHSLEVILGSVGLRAEMRPGMLIVRDAEEVATDEAELLDQAMVAYLRATSRHPQHPLAARARLTQGDIERERGNLSAALTHYETLMENFRASPLLPDALLRSGWVLADMSLWSDAAEQFRKLANLPTPHDFADESRFQLARCYVGLGDHTRALQVLNALDASYPPHEDEEDTRRLLLRARALNGSAMHLEALRTLDVAERIGLSPRRRSTAMALRAESFEGLELLGEASRAWLVRSQAVTGEERTLALENAARLALEDGDELGVIFIHQQASNVDSGLRLDPYVREARMRLGLDVRIAAGDAALADRLDMAEEWLAAGKDTDAASLLEALFEERSATDEETRTRITLALASALDETRGIDQALAVLRMVRGETDVLEERAKLDRHAARLLENHERFDDAVDAYQGSY